jgi:hypothetical protein
MKTHTIIGVGKNAREVMPWLTAMTSQLLSMSFVCWLIERTSHPIRRGACIRQDRFAAMKLKNV